MSKDKYPCIFSHQMASIVYICIRNAAMAETSVSTHDIRESKLPVYGDGARFSKAPERFRARKAIFSL